MPVKTSEKLKAESSGHAPDVETPQLGISTTVGQLVDAAAAIGALANVKPNEVSAGLGSRIARLYAVVQAELTDFDKRHAELFVRFGVPNEKTGLFEIRQIDLPARRSYDQELNSLRAEKVLLPVCQIKYSDLERTALTLGQKGLLLDWLVLDDSEPEASSKGGEA